MPDASRPTASVRASRLIESVNWAFPRSGDGARREAAFAWIAFTRPDLADGIVPDPLVLVRHTALLGRDDEYFAGLMRLFRRSGMGDDQ